VVARRAHGPVNFPDAQSPEEEFLAPSFGVIRRDEEHHIRREYMRMSIRQADKVAMTQFCSANPELVHEEVDF
jgi:hypothetical protein